MADTDSSAHQSEQLYDSSYERSVTDHTCATVVVDDKGVKSLQFAGPAGRSTIPADICQQSGTLGALLETEGETVLPVYPTTLQRWSLFASQELTLHYNSDIAGIAYFAELIEVRTRMNTLP